MRTRKIWNFDGSVFKIEKSQDHRIVSWNRSVVWDKTSCNRVRNFVHSHVVFFFFLVYFSRSNDFFRFSTIRILKSVINAHVIDS